VSVQDHADVPLLYPGVARSSARWTDDDGIEVVVATANGEEPVIADVTAFLNARRDTTLPMRVIPAVPVEFFLTIDIEHDPAYLTETIRLAVQDSLLRDDADAPGMFTFAARSFGQAAHLSEIYERVAAVEGVSFVDVTQFRLDDTAGVVDLVRVNPAQWLSLPPANLTLSIAPGVVE
jgi:hypothetical protein